MRKKILIYVLVFLTLCFSFGCILECRAEEIPTEEVPTEEVIEGNENIEEGVIDEVTFSEQVQDFLNTWFTPLMTSIAGILGSSVGVLILKSIIKALEKKIEKQNEKANENNNVADDKLSKAEEELRKTEEKLLKAEERLEKTQEDLQNYISEFKELAKNQKEILSQDEKFKELIAIMFATTPELMNNGVSSKILELLDEKEVDNNE